MDLLRSCYPSTMRLFSDRPDVTTPGRWYFCPPGAKYVRFNDRFVSMNWDNDRLDGPPPIGEFAKLSNWSSGVAPPRYKGVNTCGSAAAWLNGVPYAQRGTPAVDVDGYPTCCVLNPPPPPEFCLLADPTGEEILISDGSGCIQYHG